MTKLNMKLIELKFQHAMKLLNGNITIGCPEDMAYRVEIRKLEEQDNLKLEIYLVSEQEKDEAEKIISDPYTAKSVAVANRTIRIYQEQQEIINRIMTFTL